MHGFLLVASRRELWRVVICITLYLSFFSIARDFVYIRTPSTSWLAINNANVNRSATTRSASPRSRQAYEDMDVRRYNKENRDTHADRSYGDECQCTSTRTLSMASSAATLRPARSQVILFASFRLRQLMWAETLRMIKLILRDILDPK